jgi:hypothetical protein
MLHVSSAPRRSILLSHRLQTFKQSPGNHLALSSRFRGGLADKSGGL